MNAYYYLSGEYFAEGHSESNESANRCLLIKT